MTFKIVVVGGGTAGIMASTYLKAFWGSKVDVISVYDHKTPGIGVGESLTPSFDEYLKYTGVSTIDLIKNCGAAIKLGLKFVDWVPGKSWVHTFVQNELLQFVDETHMHYNSIDAYDIATGVYDNAYGYGYHYFENNYLPSPDNLSYRHALHVDATKVSKYIEGRFKDHIETIDGVVVDCDVVGDTIQNIVLADGRRITADLFIDATGLARLLMSKLTNTWNSMGDILPTNRTIPNPLFADFDNIPPYTTANATEDGWILDVPLQNRHGTGYVYSSNFTTDEQAKERFDHWLKNKYGVGLQSDRVIKFESGHWSKHWVGNCIALGLAGGFVEPLEATNIHHTFAQLRHLTTLHPLNDTVSHSRNLYNTTVHGLYNNAFRYVRYFYSTGRRDSEFWRYMDDNTPEWLVDLKQTAASSFLSTQHIEQGHMFEARNFIVIGHGHGFFSPESAEAYLKNKFLWDHARVASERIRRVKSMPNTQRVNHRQWINSVLNS